MGIVPWFSGSSYFIVGVSLITDVSGVEMLLSLSREFLRLSFNSEKERQNQL